MWLLYYNKKLPYSGVLGTGKHDHLFQGNKENFSLLIKGTLKKKIIGNNAIYLSNSFSYILCIRSSAETTRVLKNAILTFIRSWRYWPLASWLTGSVLVSAMGKTENYYGYIICYTIFQLAFCLSRILKLTY